MPLLFAAILLSGCAKKTTEAPKKTSAASTKILVNELSFADRPFTVLVPHTSNRIFTFYTQDANKANTATLDLEYQSGDLLKGARATLDTPIPNPFVKAIVLGSCSTGGKCTFDTDLKSGTMKFKLDIPGASGIHLLKGDFTFVTGQKNLPDGKVVFESSKTNSKDNLILMNSLGTPLKVEKPTVLYPIILSATTEKSISGTLTINQSGVAEVLLYDGSLYKPLKYTTKDNSVVISLSEKPWKKTVNIIRDDQKGAQETIDLYIIGPIVLVQ